jgi:hypothetical protein
MFRQLHVHASTACSGRRAALTSSGAALRPCSCNCLVDDYPCRSMRKMAVALMSTRLQRQTDINGTFQGDLPS